MIFTTLIFNNVHASPENLLGLDIVNVKLARSLAKSNNRMFCMKSFNKNRYNKIEAASKKYMKDSIRYRDELNNRLSSPEAQNEFFFMNLLPLVKRKMKDKYKAEYKKICKRFAKKDFKSKESNTTIEYLIDGIIENSDYRNNKEKYKKDLEKVCKSYIYQIIRDLGDSRSVKTSKYKINHKDVINETIDFTGDNIISFASEILASF